MIHPEEKYAKGIITYFGRDISMKELDNALGIIHLKSFSKDESNEWLARPSSKLLREQDSKAPRFKGFETKRAEAIKPIETKVGKQVKTPKEIGNSGDDVIDADEEV
jgi:hypothetical protein